VRKELKAGNECVQEEGRVWSDAGLQRGDCL